MKKIVLWSVILTVLYFVLVGFFFMSYLREAPTSLVRYFYGANNQCVAYVERYYKNLFGIEIKNVGRAMLLPAKAEKYGLHFHPNGGVVIPQPGDILVFGNKNGVGHVAIITGTLRNGVLIVEQNWLPFKITSNKGKALPAEYKDGHYYILDRYYGENKTARNKFWVIGWVSRSEKNPGRFFNFSDKDLAGWLPESDLKLSSGEPEVLTLKATGRNPSLVSPVFLDGLDVSLHKTVYFRAKVENNTWAKKGILYLRDEHDRWSEQIPFQTDFSEENQVTFAIDLSHLRKDFKITQVKLRLSDNSRWGEIWKIDWFRIGERERTLLR